MLGWCSYSRTRPDLPTHRHRGAVEIHYLDRGRQVFEVEGEEYELHGGDMFFTWPGEAHSTGGRPVEPCTLYRANVRLPAREKPLLGLPQDESKELLAALHALPLRHFRGTPQVKRLFDRLIGLHLSGDQPLRRMRMRQAMVELVLETVDCAARHTIEPRGSFVPEIIKIIQSRPGDEFRIEDLARRAGYSLSWFKMRFKEKTGLSPRQFILRTKIDVACRRLATTSDPIAAIAEELGFVNSQYFASVFRRLMRVSPRVYRNQDTIPRQASRRRDDGQK
jgi:AraC-like DNA-binding protein